MSPAEWGPTPYRRPPSGGDVMTAALGMALAVLIFVTLAVYVGNTARLECRAPVPAETITGAVTL